MDPMANPPATPATAAPAIFIPGEIPLAGLLAGIGGGAAPYACC